MAEEVQQKARREMRSEAHTQQTFARFIRDLSTRLDLPDERLVQVTVLVLGALEQRLQGGEAEHLHAQLPRKLQELLDARPGKKEERGVPASGVEFVQAVALPLNLSFTETEPVIRAVFATVREHISEGEARDIESQLPPDLWSLWALSQ